MKNVVIILTLALVVLGLHCYALHKRVAFYKGECEWLAKVLHHHIVNEKGGK